MFQTTKMTEQELLDIITSWENIELTIQEIGNRPEYFPVLLNLALHSKNRYSWRAAYLVDKIHDDYPDLIILNLPTIIAKLKTETNASKKRHWLKLIGLNRIEKEHFGFLFDYCLQAFTSAKEPIAVRVHAMQILYNISEEETDLKHEVLETILHEMEYHSSAGIKSRGKKLVKKLQQQLRYV